MLLPSGFIRLTTYGGETILVRVSAVDQISSCSPDEGSGTNVYFNGRTALVKESRDEVHYKLLEADEFDGSMVLDDALRILTYLSAVDVVNKENVAFLKDEAKTFMNQFLQGE